MNRMPKEIIDRNRWDAKQKLNALKTKIAKLEKANAKNEFLPLTGEKVGR